MGMLLHILINIKKYQEISRKFCMKKTGTKKGQTGTKMAKPALKVPKPAPNFL